jgi:outer membrane protein OmpA-like peptidoglycan-associated protein
MARYATYPSPSASPITRKWLLRAFLLSLLIHLGLFIFAYLKKLDDFGFSDTSRPVPAKFVVNKVTIDPKLLEPADGARKPDIKTVTPPPVDVPPEKPMVKEIEIKPSATEAISPLLDVAKEKPTPINTDTLIKTDAISAGEEDKQLSALASTLLKDTPHSRNQPVMRLRNGTPDGDTADNGSGGIPGRQSIDDALNRIGSASVGDKIAMKGGALFDYDKADLRPDAVDDMDKLGVLILRNPKATFRIEGHTDSKGGRDYNLDLSQRRADAVKAWLVGHLKIDPARITTVGYANDRPIVPPDRSIDEQQPNRRVEIVILANPAN